MLGKSPAKMVVDEDLGSEGLPLLSPPYPPYGQSEERPLLPRFGFWGDPRHRLTRKSPWGALKRWLTLEARESDDLYGLGKPDSVSTTPSTSLRLRKRAVCLATGIIILSFVVILLLLSAAYVCWGSARTISQFSSPSIQRSWGAYTPYFSAEPYTPPPDDCRITQVNIIQRHGARVPTFGSSLGIIAAVEKLQEATNYTTSELNFLSNYTYTLAMNGDLLPFGAFQSEESGYETYKRYSNLISHGKEPFVRASSGIRVVESANNWTLGFSIASNKVYTPKVSVILSESRNDTLDNNMCPNVGSSDDKTDIWAKVYATRIAARLNAQAPGANLTPANIPFLMALCAFESIANDQRSPFCTLFTPQEFEQYEYFVDVGKYYGTGHGAYLGRVQGVGYVNELIARLTETPVSDSTQTNRTLDSSPITFPLNRTLYADFSHDNQMVAIYAAIGLFKQSAHLDPAQPDSKRTWFISRLTPFSGRMVTERLTCIRRSVRHGGAGYSTMHSRETFIRILVNDALQPLEFCGGDKDGLCTLSAFVDSQTYSRENGQGDFEKCLE